MTTFLKIGPKCPERLLEYKSANTEFRKNWKVLSNRGKHGGYDDTPIFTLERVQCKLSGVECDRHRYIKKDFTSRSKNLLMRKLDIHFRLDSPHIVAIYACYEDEENIFILLQPMDGDLDDLLEHKGRLEEDTINLRIARPLLRALRYLHDQHDIIHRCVQPSSIFFNGDRCFLGNFSLSVCQKEGTAKSVVGPVQFFAPELSDVVWGQINDGATADMKKGVSDALYNEKIDIWALGVTIYWLLYQMLPFRGTTVREVLIAQRDTDPFAAQPKRGTVSRAALDFLARCFEPLPKRRQPAKVLLSSCPWVSDGADDQGGDGFGSTFREFIASNPSSFKAHQSGNVGPYGLLQVSNEVKAPRKSIGGGVLGFDFDLPDLEDELPSAGWPAAHPDLLSKLNMSGRASAGFSPSVLGAAARPTRPSGGYAGGGHTGGFKGRMDLSGSVTGSVLGLMPHAMDPRTSNALGIGAMPMPALPVTSFTYPVMSPSFPVSHTGSYSSQVSPFVGTGPKEPGGPGSYATRPTQLPPSIPSQKKPPMAGGFPGGAPLSVLSSGTTAVSFTSNNSAASSGTPTFLRGRKGQASRLAQGTFDSGGSKGGDSAPLTHKTLRVPSPVPNVASMGEMRKLRPSPLMEAFDANAQSDPITRRELGGPISRTPKSGLANATVSSPMSEAPSFEVTPVSSPTAASLTPSKPEATEEAGPDSDVLLAGDSSHHKLPQQSTSTRFVASHGHEGAGFQGGAHSTQNGATAALIEFSDRTKGAAIAAKEGEAVAADEVEIEWSTDRSPLKTTKLMTQPTCDSDDFYHDAATSPTTMPGELLHSSAGLEPTQLRAGAARGSKHQSVSAPEATAPSKFPDSSFVSTTVKPSLPKSESGVLPAANLQASHAKSQAPARLSAGKTVAAPPMKSSGGLFACCFFKPSVEA